MVAGSVYLAAFVVAVDACECFVGDDGLVGFG